MLHILWLVLKSIGILFGGILGLALLAIGLVLFCPVRYAASAQKQEEDFKKTKLHFTVSWLFHIVCVKGRFEEGSFTTKIQLFGISLEKFKRKKSSKKKKDSKAVKKTVEENPIHSTEEKNKSVKIEKSEEATQSDTSVITEKSGIVEENTEEPNTDKKRSFIEIIKNILVVLENKLKKIGNVGSTIRKLGERIAKKIHKLRDKIQGILDKLNWWKCFLEDQKVQASIVYVKARLWRVCKHVLPTKIVGNVTFGNEDPSVTGTVLAILGITIPFHKNCIEITPLFDDENILTGTISLKGRVYTIVLLIEALKVILNKNVRYMIAYWKNKEEA